MEFLLRNYSLLKMGEEIEERVEELQHATDKSAASMKMKSLKGTIVTTYKKHILEF